MAFGKFGKYYPGGVEYLPTDLELRATLEREFEGFRAQCAEPGRLDFQAGQEPIPLRTDAKHLRYIVVNLLQNALKYSPSDEPVTMRLERRAGRAVLSVRDRGIGIPESELEELFSPFYRASNVESRPGTGMGLAIVKKSARLIGAEIRVESRLGAGTRFELLLPL